MFIAFLCSWSSSFLVPPLYSFSSSSSFPSSFYFYSYFYFYFDFILILIAMMIYMFTFIFSFIFIVIAIWEIEHNLITDCPIDLAFSLCKKSHLPILILILTTLTIANARKLYFFFCNREGTILVDGKLKKFIDKKYVSKFTENIEFNN